MFNFWTQLLNEVRANNNYNLVIYFLTGMKCQANNLNFDEQLTRGKNYYYNLCFMRYSYQYFSQILIISNYFSCILNPDILHEKSVL